MESPVLLIYHMQQPRQAALEAVCAAMKIRPVIVSDGDGRVPVLTSFLSTLREQGLVIALKAIETDENRYWNGEMLQDELKKERESFRGR